MATLFVQSRFAGLKIEDDEIPVGDNQKVKKGKTNLAKKIEPPKKSKTNNGKTQAVPKKRKQKPAETTKEQWELWKQKDEEMVDGNFESELQEAILLSKLDYEEKKDVYQAFKKAAETEKKIEQTRSGNKKIKKKNVMSLEQFNGLVNTDDSIENYRIHEKSVQEEEKVTVEKDTDFFNRVQDETKNEILKDKIISRVRHQTITDETITRAQFVDALEKKDQEISALREEIISLKQELLTVKSRNRKLCNILGQGEMKDKAEVLVEVEKLRAVQAELTGELAALHTDLERERSKNTDPRTKDKKKRGGNIDKEK